MNVQGENMINENNFSICVTSYKRINELKRCLESIDYKGKSKIEIIISEDCSENREIIRQVVEDYSQKAEYDVIFNTNEKNLGYDRNLAKLIELASGDYIIFISDDDKFIEGALDKIIKEIEDGKYGCMFSPFIESDKTMKRYYSKSFIIEKGNTNAGKFIYESILFSGLIFKKSVVQNQSADQFVGLNYFQVYLFLLCMVNYDCKYINIPLINCIGDGTNGFGENEFQINELLSNRNSVFSNLEFHKGLIKVIKMFDSNYRTNIISCFQKEYSLRTYTGLSLAAKQSKKVLKDYYSCLNQLDIKLTMRPKVYFYMLLVLGTKGSDLVIDLFKKAVSLYRSKFAILKA